MTAQEAIKQLKCDMELITFNPNNGEVIPVECLNDLNRATYEADKIAISALEKQIAVSRTIVEGEYFCPRCKYVMRHPGYCRKCGQHAY